MTQKDCSQDINEDLTIRNIRIEDIPKIYALGEKLFLPDVSVTLYRTWDQYEIAELFFSDTEYCLVAEDACRLVGFIMGTVVEKPRTGRRYGYILWLGTAKAYQGRGIADLLVRRLLRRFRSAGAQMVLADTAAENQKAIHFFAKHGFTGVQEHVYLSKNLAAERRQNGKKGKKKAVSNTCALR